MSISENFVEKKLGTNEPMRYSAWQRGLESKARDEGFSLKSDEGDPIIDEAEIVKAKKRLAAATIKQERRETLAEIEERTPAEEMEIRKLLTEKARRDDVKL